MTPDPTAGAPRAHDWPGRRRAIVRAMPAGAAVGAVLAGLVAALTSPPARAQDRADLDRSAIIGNRELPKVLYIVPWKKPGPLTMSGRPVASVLDEALAPVDRDVFRRQIGYDAQLRAAAAPGPTPAAPSASPAPVPAAR